MYLQLNVATSTSSIVEYTYVFLCILKGLLRGDPVPQWDGPAGAQSAADPSVVSEGHLPAGVCPQRPGPAQSQVSDS